MIRAAPGLLFAGALLLALTAPAARGDEPDEVPLVGRPADLPFSEASAGFASVAPGREDRPPFAVETSASPAEVEGLQPVTFTITVRALGKVRRPPVRLDLSLLPSFSRRFHIFDVTDGQKEKSGEATWRWAYQLRPRTA